MVTTATELLVGASAGLAYADTHRCHVLWNQINIAAAILKNTTWTAAEKIASGDILQAINMPARTLVYCCGFWVDTASTDATLTVDLGVAGGSEAIDTGFDLTAAAGTGAITLVGDSWGVNTLQGKLISTADTLDVVFNNDATNGKFTVWAVVFDVSCNLTTG